MRVHWRIQQADAAHLWLISGIALAFLPHLSRLPWLIILPSAALLGWRLAYELKLAALPTRLLRLFLTLLAMASTFVSYHTILGREAGVALLTIMLCLKLLEMRSERDVAVSIGLGYFEVITVFLFDQSIFMGLYMLLVVTLLTTALAAFSRSQAGLPQWQNLRLAGIMLAQAAPLTLLLFVLFPRIPGPLWNLPSDAGGASSTGLSDTLSPGRISQLSDNDAVAFRVQFENDIPASDKLYWRGPVMNYFDGESWKVANRRQRSETLASPGAQRVMGQAVHYTITLEPHQRQWLFGLDIPSELPPDSYLSADHELLAKEPVKQLYRYRLSSHTEYKLDAFLYPDSERYLQLPRNSSPRSRQLARELLRQTMNSADPDTELVQLALRYFQEQPFFYSRTPPLLGDEPIDEFLFDTRRGFCEHYASAFTFLMRAAGIPARIVTGYQGGESNPLGDYFIVRQADAHAWSEVWLKGAGWVRIDPTTVIPPSRIEARADLERIAPDVARRIDAPHWATQVWRRIGYGWDSLNHAWNQWIVGYDDDSQSRFLSTLGLEGIRWQGMVSLLFAGLTLIFSVIAIQMLHTKRRGQDPVVAAYKNFTYKLSKLGLGRRPQEGAEHYAQRIEAARPDLRASIRHITRLYQALRYSAKPPKHGLQQLTRAVRRFQP
jgi:transglutaminase-like putative cysteine protease